MLHLDVLKEKVDHHIPVLTRRADEGDALPFVHDEAMRFLIHRHLSLTVVATPRVVRRVHILKRDDVTMQQLVKNNFKYILEPKHAKFNKQMG